MYRVNIVAAPPGPRAEGVVVPPAANAAARAHAAPPPAARADAAQGDADARPRSPRKPFRRHANARAHRHAAQGAAQAGGRRTRGRTRAPTSPPCARRASTFPFPGYLENIVRQIAKNFGEHRNTNARAEVPFLIRRDGSVSAISFLTRSGDYSFDLDAQGAVESAGNARAFGPLPNGFSDDVLPVIFSFDPTVVH